MRENLLHDLKSRTQQPRDDSGFLIFWRQHGDLVYKEMYGAKIIFGNRKFSPLPGKFAALASTSRKYPWSYCMKLSSTQVRLHRTFLKLISAVISLSYHSFTSAGRVYVPCFNLPRSFEFLKVDMVADKHSNFQLTLKRLTASFFVMNTTQMQSSTNCKWNPQNPQF